MKSRFRLLSYLFATLLFCFTASGQVGGRAAIVAIDEAVGSANVKPKDSGGASGGKITYSGEKKQGSKGTSKGGGEKAGGGSRTVALRSASPSPKPFGGPILGDKYTFLNYEVATPVRPIYTIAAKKAGAKGLVQVEVLVDENGDVLTAKARTGDQLLWEEAERAAKETKFNSPRSNGQPARAMGFLVYRFGPAEEDE